MAESGLSIVDCRLSNLGSGISLVGHGVHDVVDAQLESQIDVFAGIGRRLGPLPGVSQIHIVVDHHHQTP